MLLECCLEVAPHLVLAWTLDQRANRVTHQRTPNIFAASWCLEALEPGAQGVDKSWGTARRVRQALAESLIELARSRIDLSYSLLGDCE